MVPPIEDAQLVGYFFYQDRNSRNWCKFCKTELPRPDTITKLVSISSGRNDPNEALKASRYHKYGSYPTHDEGTPTYWLMCLNKECNLLGEILLER